MKAGDAITLSCGRRNPQGAPASGRQASDFVVSVNGVLVNGATFQDVGAPTGSAWEIYSFSFTDSSTAGERLYVIEPAANAYQTDAILNGVWSGPMEAYDETAVANLLLAQQGTPGVLSAADANLGDIVDGNAFLSPVLTLTPGKLSPFGIIDVTGLTLEAACMRFPGDTPVLVTPTLLSGPLLQFTVGWNSGAGVYPFSNLTTQVLQAWYMDIRVIKPGPPQQIITTNRYTFNQVWRRDTRTS